MTTGCRNIYRRKRTIGDWSCLKRDSDMGQWRFCGQFGFLRSVILTICIPSGRYAISIADIVIWIWPTCLGMRKAELKFRDTGLTRGIWMLEDSRIYAGGIVCLLWTDGFFCRS